MSLKHYWLELQRTKVVLPHPTHWLVRAPRSSGSPRDVRVCMLTDWHDKTYAKKLWFREEYKRVTLSASFNCEKCRHRFIETGLTLHGIPRNR